MGWVGPKNPGPICSRERCNSKVQVQRIVGAMLGVWFYDNRCGVFCACHGSLWHNPSKLSGFTFFWPRNRWVWYLNWFSLESNLANPPKVRTSVQALPRKGAAFKDGFFQTRLRKKTTQLFIQSEDPQNNNKEQLKILWSPSSPQTSPAKEKQSGTYPSFFQT